MTDLYASTSSASRVLLRGPFLLRVSSPCGFRGNSSWERCLPRSSLRPSCAALSLFLSVCRDLSPSCARLPSCLSLNDAYHALILFVEVCRSDFAFRISEIEFNNGITSKPLFNDNNNYHFTSSFSHAVLKSSRFQIINLIAPRN